MIQTAPKLTYAHFHLGPFKKIKVNLAVEIFSHTVAAGMPTALNIGILPNNLIPTINYINDVDKLFDIFNFSDTFNSNIFNDPFDNNSQQLDDLKKMTDIFKNMNIVSKLSATDMTQRVNFSNGCLVYIYLV